MAQPPPNRTPAKHPRQPSGVPVSSQRYLDIAQVRDGVVVLRDGSLRAVILVNAVNFALKSEEEQNALVYAYQGFLNSFTFPIQIVMQSRQLDLVHYLKKLSDQLAETTNELIQLQITDYIQFIERLIQIANIMDKKFYVTVPFTPLAIRQRGWFDKLFNPGNRMEVRMSPAEFKSYRQELLERTRIIMGGLGGLGLRSALLGTQETIELLYATYNPEEATKERLSAVGMITGAYVHPPAPQSGANPNGQIPNLSEAPSSNVETQTPQSEAVNPLATVAPEQPSQESGIRNQELGIDQPAEAPSVADNSTNAVPTTDLQLPTPLGLTVAPPAESPDAGRAAFDQANSKQQTANSPTQQQHPAAASAQTPASNIQLPVPQRPIAPTTGFGQAVKN